MRLSLLTIFFAVLTLPAIAGEAVTYFDGDTELEGYYAPSTCDGDAPRPAVLVIHQWKGLGEYEKGRADMLAGLCYNAFAVDMYGKGIRPETREEAGAQAGKYKGDAGLARGRINAALAHIRTLDNVDGDSVAAMGYCFGGTMALELARSGADIDGVISFHGGLSTPEPAKQGTLKAAVQVHHGAADPHVPPAQVDGFMQEMDNAGADWVLIHYADAVHAFTEKHAGNDPSKGVAYNEKADRRSWAATLTFLEEIFADEG